MKIDIDLVTKWLLRNDCYELKILVHKSSVLNTNDDDEKLARLETNKRYNDENVDKLTNNK